jgi:RimJ/RimL family protein N-acetyltransferase
MTLTSVAAPGLAAPPGEVGLRDGTRVRVRPIGPEDKDRLRVGLHQLSPASRYHRFHAAVSELSDEQLRYLTEIDQVNHLAWIALDPTLPGEPAVGVARCIRFPENPGTAEVAVTVLDAYQGRGLGTLLLGLLSRSAAGQGIGTFRAYVREDNDAMLRIFRDLGAEVGCADTGVCRLDIPVPADPETLPDTPTGRVFKAVAARSLPQLVRRLGLDADARLRPRAGARIDAEEGVERAHPGDRRCEKDGRDERCTERQERKCVRDDRGPHHQDGSEHRPDGRVHAADVVGCHDSTLKGLARKIAAPG